MTHNAHPAPLNNSVADTSHAEGRRFAGYGGSEGSEGHEKRLAMRPALCRAVLRRNSLAGFPRQTVCASSTWNRRPDHPLGQNPLLPRRNIESRFTPQSTDIAAPLENLGARSAHNDYSRELDFLFVCDLLEELSSKPRTRARLFALCRTSRLVGRRLVL
jgi:hypothetical protein